MPPKAINMGIMFADIKGSTRLFEILGDTVARITISETFDLLTKVVNAHKGKVVKTIGDEIMCIFPTADNCAEAANDMQETLEEVNEKKESGPEIKVRIGLHYGPALLEDGDVFGDAVNVAARMVAQAKGGQSITTKMTVDALNSALQSNTRFVDRASIKGKKDNIEIFEIIWQAEDITRMATGMIANVPKNPHVSLQIHYRGQNITLNQKKPSLVIGRSQTCDLPVNEKLASRQHVRIELRRNKFFIIDQSTNGTHVKLDSAEVSFLRREEMSIVSNGEISLGKPFSENPMEIVAFTLLSP